MSKNKGNNIQLSIGLITSARSIIFQEAQTILHCSYTAPGYFLNGGWINISPDTFLINQNGDGKLKLIYHENIPLLPIRHYFNRPGEIIKFSLIFEGMPKSWERFNLIEKAPWGERFSVKNIRKNDAAVYQINLS